MHNSYSINDGGAGGGSGGGNILNLPFSFFLFHPATPASQPRAVLNSYLYWKLSVPPRP